MEKENDTEIIDFLFDSIKKIFNKNKYIISILALPQNKQKIFQKLISDLYEDNKAILYVLGNKNDRKYVLDDITNIKVDFIDFSEISEIKKKYYLVIWDDVTSLVDLTKEQKIDMIQQIKKLSKRTIIYTIEKLIDEGEIVDLAPIQIKTPFVEPRVIQTRVNLCEDIPYILYECIEWFIREKKKIVIYVPNEEALNKVYSYYQKKIKLKYVEIVPIAKNEDENFIRDILKNKNEATIIITDNVCALFEDTNINGAIVLFADDEFYSTRKLLFLCGEIYRINKDLPEVLLVAKTESESMDRIKAITRNINKRVWKESF